MLNSGRIFSIPNVNAAQFAPLASVNGSHGSNSGGAVAVQPKAPPGGVRRKRARAARPRTVRNVLIADMDETLVRSLTNSLGRVVELAADDFRKKPGGIATIEPDAGSIQLLPGAIEMLSSFDAAKLLTASNGDRADAIVKNSSLSQFFQPESIFPLDRHNWISKEEGLRYIIRKDKVKNKTKLNQYFFVDDGVIQTRSCDAAKRALPDDPLINVGLLEKPVDVTEAEARQWPRLLSQYHNAGADYVVGRLADVIDIKNQRDAMLKACEQERIKRENAAANDASNDQPVVKRRRVGS